MARVFLHKHIKSAVVFIYDFAICMDASSKLVSISFENDFNDVLYNNTKLFLETISQIIVSVFFGKRINICQYLSDT